MKGYNSLENPYTLQFSYIPPQLIERKVITEEVIGNFIREIPTYRGVFITGVRGSGKTVMLGDIRNKIGSLDQWITVDLNPETDLLDSLARALYRIPAVKALFVEASLDFSLLGIGLHLENAELMASNEEDALDMMLKTLKKAGKKVLVTIDEVTYSKNVARFSHALSSYAGADYDVYVLMTGLADNIRNIKNKKSLTFLYRAKVKELDTLNITAISSDYERILRLDREKAEELAYETRGYSLAFQALGYHCWEALGKAEKLDQLSWEDLDRELDQTLEELAYGKIWDELSNTDRRVLQAMAGEVMKTGDNLVKIETIRDVLDMTSDTFTTYRSRLLESGIVDGKQYGYLKFRLPRFEQFVTRIRYE